MAKKKSKQRRWQERQRELGLCQVCNNKAVGWFCDFHRQQRHDHYIKRTEGKRRRNRCSVCGNPGHYRTTCREAQELRRAAEGMRA